MSTVYAEVYAAIIARYRRHWLRWLLSPHYRWLGRLDASSGASVEASIHACTGQRLRLFGETA